MKLRKICRTIAFNTFKVGDLVEHIYDKRFVYRILKKEYFNGAPRLSMKVSDRSSSYAFDWKELNDLIKK